MVGASDEEHLAFALKNERVIITQNADFLRLNNAGETHAGIIHTLQRLPIGTVIRGLMLIHEALEPEDMLGEVEYL